MANDQLSPTPSQAHADPGDFRVRAPTEIRALLREMLDRQTLIILSEPDGATLNTRLCALESEHRALGFDVRAGDPQLQALLDADEVLATAYLDDIRLEFELEGLVLLNGSSSGGTGATVLRSASPMVLHRFQRRQSFRVRPNTRTPQVRLQHPDHLQPMRLRIIDLSIGGLALLLPPEAAGTTAAETIGAAGASAPWPVGTLLPVLVELDRNTRFDAILRLQHVSATDASGMHIGFAWAKIDPVALRTLQLFIDQTQKLSRLLRSKS